MKHIEGERDSDRMVNAARGSRIQIGLRLPAMVFPPELPWMSVCLRRPRWFPSSLRS